MASKAKIATREIVEKEEIPTPEYSVGFEKIRELVGKSVYLRWRFGGDGGTVTGLLESAEPPNEQGKRGMVQVAMVSPVLFRCPVRAVVDIEAI